MNFIKINKDKFKTIRYQDGILIVNKPVGVSSSGLLGVLKKLSTNKIKIGHTGTLDVEAKGLLVIGIGSYTKKLPSLLNSIKTYKTTIIFGNKTSTANQSGEIISQFKPFNHITKEKINETLEKYFTGEVVQKAPVYSALKYDGRRLSDLHQCGYIVDPPTRLLNIYDSKCTYLKLPIAEFELRVSSGFYIRSFAEDISTKLGTEGYCFEINRVANGPYNEVDSITIDEITNETVNNNIQNNTNRLLNIDLNQFMGVKSKELSSTKIKNKE